ncbi:hypothetical protein [Flagellimonas sediminis]|uniref:Uncharacterized protein n=1 Tax=Flagellimonas sediminis TaxID=2696468 RepID=A0A6I5KZH2_9FLAO|nr:hypothetical protein [Allomuricauda sediminis]NDV43732.1 hypothetical protein [Allomuricauda sediminis]
MSPNSIGILIGICGLMVIFLTKNKANTLFTKKLWHTSLILFLSYTILLLFVEIRWEYLQYYASRFDLNQDGTLDWNESTDEALNALQKASHDTARNFAFLTTALFSTLIATLFFIANHLFSKKSKNPSI